MLLPLASLSWTVMTADADPLAVTVADDVEIVLVAGDAEPASTVTAALPTTPLTVAVMLTVPFATAVTRPPVVTVAVGVLLLAQVTTGDRIVSPFRLNAVAANCFERTAPEIVKVPGLTTTVAALFVTRTLAVTVGPGALGLPGDEPVSMTVAAVMITLPVSTAVTSPLASTVATLGLLELHVTSGLRIVALRAFRTSGVYCSVRLIARRVSSAKLSAIVAGLLNTVTLIESTRNGSAGPVAAAETTLIVTTPVSEEVTTPAGALGVFVTVTLVASVVDQVTVPRPCVPPAASLSTMPGW